MVTDNKSCGLVEREYGMKGFLLIHGKGTGPIAEYESALMNLYEELQPHGLIDYRDYGWAKDRIYSRTVEESISDIEEARLDLISAGADKDEIYVVGYSLGGNMGIAYSGIHGEKIKGLILLDPGHTLHTIKFQSTTRESYLKAKEAVENGRGDDILDLNDMNNGEITELKSPAKNFYSFFNPLGLANMQLSSAKIMKPMNVLLISALLSPVTKTVAGIYNNINKTNKSTMVSLNTDHKGVPPLSLPYILNWIKTL